MTPATDSLLAAFAPNALCGDVGRAINLFTG